MKQFLITVAGVLVGLVLFLFVGPIILFSMIAGSVENRPARLDLTFYPYLPAATVGTTDPRAYLGLIASPGLIPSAERISA